MADIPILHPTGISSDPGHHGLILRIRVEDVMMRPIRSDSQPNVRGNLRGALRGNARRGLAHEHLRGQRQHNTCNNTPHVRPPPVLSETRVRLNTGTGGVTSGEYLLILPCCATIFCRGGVPSNKVTRVISGLQTRAQQGSRVCSSQGATETEPANVAPE